MHGAIFFLKSFNEFLQGREVTSLVIDHGTPACTRCGVMETKDSETAGWVSSLIFLFIKEKKIKIIRCYLTRHVIFQVVT